MIPCTICREDGHLTNDCPTGKRIVAARAEVEEPRSTADDVNDALQDRNLGLRAALRAVLVEARRAGLVFTPSTATLIAAADSFDP